jgi:hypothetical protein
VSLARRGHNELRGLTLGEEVLVLHSRRDAVGGEALDGENKTKQNTGNLIVVPIFNIYNNIINYLTKVYNI